MNFDRLRFVAERAEVGEAREALFAVTIPERPGAFREFCATIGRRVVTEFNYRLSGRSRAHIFVGIGTDSRQNAIDLTALLRSRGYEAVDLSEDELAKLHVRYMVGGRSSDVRNERLYRFEFPERPGALMAFLERLGDRWNISLFHYRNHGSDFGRVLAGFEVPDADAEPFDQFLELARLSPPARRAESRLRNVSRRRFRTSVFGERVVGIAVDPSLAGFGRRDHRMVAGLGSAWSRAYSESCRSSA